VIARRSGRPSIGGPRDLADIVSAPNLAVVPRHPLDAPRPDDVTMFREPNSVEAEGYRSLRTALQFVLRDPSAASPTTAPDPGPPDDGGFLDVTSVERPVRTGPGTILLVTSPRPGEGKSSVAANLAAAEAMAGRRVVLVDGDLRKPQVHRLFRLRNEVGLASVLTGGAKLGDAVQRLDGTPNLAILSAGPPPPDPAEVLANERLGPVLSGLAQAADLVVVDAPPLLPVADPTMIVQHCDVALLVATAGISERREWTEAIPRLEVVGATVVGTVVLQPDDRVHASTSYRYAPSAVPPNWWVVRATERDDAPADPPSLAEPSADPHDPPDTPADASSVTDRWPTRPTSSAG
jgi:capsular exopolysaccharide synthesis family protein